MGKPSRRYIGDLFEKDEPGLNVGSFVVEGAENQAVAIDQLVRLAQGRMEQKEIAVATLRMSEDGGAVIASIELENPKHAQGS